MPKIEKLYNEDFSMRFFRFGNGEKTFVILPGLSITSVMDAAAAVADAYQMFGEEYTVYLFDRRSDLPEDYPIAAMAKDTAKAFELLGLKDIDLFGASQGGMIAMNIAAEYPELIHKLVLGSTAAYVSEETAKGVDAWTALAKEGKAEELEFGFAKLVYPEAIYEQSQELIDALKDNPGLQSYIYEGFGHAAYDLAPDYKERMLEFFRD